MWVAQAYMNHPPGLSSPHFFAAMLTSSARSRHDSSWLPLQKSVPNLPDAEVAAAAAAAAAAAGDEGIVGRWLQESSAVSSVRVQGHSSGMTVYAERALGDGGIGTRGRARPQADNGCQ